MAKGCSPCVRKALLEALERLAGAGSAADKLLVQAEGEHAASPRGDERAMQTLGALSREVWVAHKATLRAIAAVRQYDGIIPPPAK